MTYPSVASIAFSTSLLFALPACNIQSGTPPAPRTITVSGEGLVRVAPDQFELSAGIETRAKDVKVVKKQSDEVMANILATVKSFKIEDKDIQTDFARIDPQYGQPPQEQQITAFIASRSVRILLRDITQFEPLAAKLFEQGTNVLSNVTFHSSQKLSLEAEARTLAIRDAKERAEAMAKELGFSLGRALQVHEGDSRENRFSPMAFAGADMAKSSAPRVTLAVGEILIPANVSIVFELK